MKLITSIVVLIIHTNIANAQEIQDIYAPEITKETEYFDLNNFSIEPQNIVLENINLNTGSKYIIKRTENYYEKDINGKTIINYRKKGNGVIEGSTYPFNSIVGVFKTFYSSGNLKKKGLVYWLGFEMGIWYEFDEKGKLIETIDMDKQYSFGWNKIYDYCIKHDISLEKVSNEKATKITKFKAADGKYCWRINYRNKKTKGEKTIIVIDAESGKVLSKKDQDWLPFERFEEED